jgi:peptidylprolyl isomerase
MSEFADYIDISGDGGLLKKILEPGTGDDYPQTGQQVTAHYTGTLDDGTKFDSSRDRGKEFVFTIGQGQVIKGWDQGFATMKKGEKAILRCRSDFAYGKGGQGVIPPDATLNFDVELIGFKDKPKEKWEMSDEEKTKEAAKLKEEGTGLFKEKRFAEAITSYEEACDYLENVDAATATWVTCKGNAAQAAINMQDYPQAVHFATEALSKDPTNVKALYRRGLSRNHIGLPDEAMEDLKKAEVR